MLMKGEAALVTGAASGIGRAVALAYAREGARVMVSDISEDGGRETVGLIHDASPGVESAFMRADASKPEDHEALVRATVERFGTLRVACNNAGVAGELNPVADLSVEGWRRVIELNLSGVFYAMRAQIPRMLEAGGGAIVNMSSVLGQVATAGAAGYVSAKHGLVGLTRVAALEYAQKGVRVNAVGPAYVDTPMLRGLTPEARQELVGLHPVGRLGRAEEVAELVVWLSSGRASFVTGAYYPVDGAYLAR
jgi:NAD(P)-dependent dehydrogenase (short-subunit alcohol dehydrogenase family)